MMTPHEIEMLADAIAERLAGWVPDDDRLIEKYEAAELLGCSVPTVERLVSRNEIPSIKVGRLRRFRRGDLIGKNKGGDQ